MTLNYYGVFIAMVMLFATGLGHIAVIKGEYYFGVKLWPVFFILGVLCVIFSIIIENILLSGSLGILGVTFLWGIHELILQRERVRKGWFPKRDSKERG